MTDFPVNLSSILDAYQLLESTKFSKGASFPNYFLKIQLVFDMFLNLKNDSFTSYFG